MFYVYEWFIVETGEIVYVGKGCGNRYKVRKHNPKFDALIAGTECESRIVAEFDSEEKAFAFEKSRIEELRKDGQCKCNINDGGFGGSAKWWTDEMRKKYSTENPMKQSTQRNRMKTNNPMRDHNTAEKVGQTKRKEIMIGKERYESLAEAMKVYGARVAYWVKVGHAADARPCYYVADGEKPVNIRRNLGGAKRIIYDGVVYDCQRDVCKKFGFASSTLSKYAKRGYTDEGIECRFEAADRVQEFVPHTGCRPIIIDNVPYDSIKAASEITGLDLRGIKYALRHSGIYKGHNCEYANQQPILVKSGKSSEEGSTTNE